MGLLLACSAAAPPGLEYDALAPHLEAWTDAELDQAAGFFALRRQERATPATLPPEALPGRAGSYAEDFRRLVDAALALMRGDRPSDRRRGKGKRRPRGQLAPEPTLALDVLLSSAKQSLVAAAELASTPGGPPAAEAEPVAWLAVLDRLVEANDELTALLEAGRGGSWSPPLSGADVVELANTLCASQPTTVREQVAARLRGTRYNAERGLLCAERQSTGRPFGLYPLAGESALGRAPLLPVTLPWASEAARLGEGPARRLRTHQLWPTLVSTAELTAATANQSTVRADAAFLRRLNKAARAAYREYRRGGEPGDEYPPCTGEPGCDDNTQFYHWQQGFLPLWVKREQPQTQRVPLAAADLERLQRLAIDACLAHVLAHRRPTTLEELGYPEPPRFQLWVSVLGGKHAANTGHSPHAHTNSVCSGAFYSKAPEASAAPIVFSDPRGAWRSLSESASLLATEQEEDGLWGRLPTQPQAPFHQQYTLTPTAGQLVVFPSWLVHHVEPQEGEERIAWSYNVVAESFMDSWARTAV